MNKMKKEKYFVGIFLIILLVFTHLNFISSDDEYEDEFDKYEDEFLEEIDISKEMGFDNVEIFGKGIQSAQLAEAVTNEEGEFDHYEIFCQIGFVEKYAYLKIDSNLFWNIVPQEEAGHPTYVKLNKDGEIIDADFTVDNNEETSFYDFNNDIIEIPSGSRIFFDNINGLYVKFPEGIDLTQFPNLMDIFSWNSNTNKTTIRGKNVTLSKEIHLIDGKLEIKKEGVLLKQGAINYNNLMLTTGTYEEGGMIYDFEGNREDYSIVSRSDVLIANSGFDLLSYKESWIRDSSDLLEIQSVEKGVIYLKFLKENNILNSNEENELLFSIMDGDGMRIKQKEDEKSIPKIIHKSSEEGLSKIQNGPLFFSYEKGKFTFDFASHENINDFIEMEIESDSTKIEEKIIIDPEHKIYADDISILDLNEKVILTYNDNSEK